MSDMAIPPLFHVSSNCRADAGSGAIDSTSAPITSRACHSVLSVMVVMVVVVVYLPCILRILYVLLLLFPVTLHNVLIRITA
jgi:hypothetical protein